MKNKETFSFLAIGVCACALAVGPKDNPDDQWRFIWDCGEQAVPDLASKGLNAFINSSGVSGWNLADGTAPKNLDEQIASFRKKLGFYQENGVEFIQRFTYGWDRGAMDAFNRVGKDGKKLQIENRIDASDPRYVKNVRDAIAAQTKLAGGHPTLIGTLTESETRGFVQPSFTPAMSNAWFAHAKCAVPELTAGRNPVPWKKIPGFPKDQIVPDDYPLFEFYRWQWRAGDGWTGYLDMVADTFAKNCSHETFSMYDPTLRCLPQWGSIGPKVTHLNHWTYPYPEPYRISYNISELQASARGNPGQKVLAMIQAISYRSVLAPKTEHPANEPAWAKKIPEGNYPTTPPDMMQEAMWTVFSRQVDGIGFHGWNALYDDGKTATSKGYVCANPKTREVIGKLFHEVGEPLGPLFKAVPERAPVVAVLESCASLVLGAHISYGVHNHFSDTMFMADAANLSPYVIYEDEVVKRGIPPSVKVLVLPKCEVLTRSVYEKVVAFQKRGGRVVADDMLLPALKPDATFVSVQQSQQEEAKTFKGDHDDGIARKAQDAELRAHSVKAAAAKLKAAVAVAPYADSDNADVLVHARSYGAADYVFAINVKRGYGPYVGAWKRVLEKGLPNSGNVVVRRSAGAVYDLVKHAAVPFTSANGETRIPVSYNTNDGRCFLVAAKPLGELKFSLSGTTLTVTSPDKDAMIPIKIVGFTTKPFYAVVKDGMWSRDFAVAPAEFAVFNLADGKAARERVWWWPF